MKRLSFSTLTIAALVIVILLAYWCTFQVRFHEVAVKKRFGQQVAVISEPGPGFRWPFIEDVTTYDKRLRTLDTPETEVKTNDGKNLIIGAYAVWTIADAKKFQTSIGNERDAEQQMRARLSQAQQTVFGQSVLADFVSLDAQQVDANYDKLLTQLKDSVAPMLLVDYGVAIQKIGITRISLPKEAAQQVFESMRQERNALATRYEQEGTAMAEGIKSKATSDRERILSFVDRRAQEIVSTGVQAATHTLSQIPAQDREFFNWLRWLDTLKATMAQRTTIFIDQYVPGELWKTFARPPAAADEALRASAPTVPPATSQPAKER